MTKKDAAFVATVTRFYDEYGRHNLPWRKTTAPYNIVVSELMLQQTQVERVVPKYAAFMRRWPTARKLTQASLGDVLIEWQGLGYNRRARLLHECSRVIVNEYANRWPKTAAGLEDLPGVGPYTAGAVMAFAYNQPVPIIETNIRTVFLHHYFKNQDQVADSEIMPIIMRTLDTDNPRAWYAALMDYGSHVKKTHPNPSRRSRHHATQSAFKGSDREIRGALVRYFTAACSAKRETSVVAAFAAFDSDRVRTQLQRLTNEGLLQKTTGGYSLP